MSLWVGLLWRGSASELYRYSSTHRISSEALHGKLFVELGSSLASVELGGTHNGSPSQFLPASATRCGRLALQWGRPALHGSGRQIGTPSRTNNSYAVQWLLSPFRFRLGRFRDPASPQKLKFQGV
ncbi:hypothetical protein Pst134EA_000866 [Puccinia striiformis f. sp. tritici]|uniref:hypothetical protein n=1 Tax=Puccinia striiformis f. sp. tritici TaxID=168172 RepID=UPI0020077B57|nr:hypothetical protein Pst134EA_000866 [Puccinia striiformis f. sp. tritici]KAH9473801.1 hypothetical protein Pst134EA_000866 [Puccinia striiformis f. sp. tritici]